MTSEIENFIFARAIPEPNSGCWLWVLAVNKDGYGKLKKNRKSLIAHRFTYEQLVGPIPAGLEIDHLCTNKSCVNPAHLEPVPTKVNIERMHKRRPEAKTRLGRIARERRDARTHCPQGHPYSGDNLRIAPSGQQVCKTCTRENMRRYRQPANDEKEALRLAAEKERASVIERMILEDYSIADISYACGISPAYIHRRFKIRPMRKRRQKASNRLVQASV